MEIKELADNIARALEDHKLIAWEQQSKTSQIVATFVDRYLRDCVKDFFD